MKKLSFLGKSVLIRKKVSTFKEVGQRYLINAIFLLHAL